MSSTPVFASTLVLASLLLGACGPLEAPPQIALPTPLDTTAPTKPKPGWLETLQLDQTLQITPPWVTLEPSRTSVPLEAILSDFPLSVGAQWIYAVEATYLGSYSDTGTITYGSWTGSLTETIIAETRRDGLQTYEVAIEVSPTPPEGVWSPPSPLPYQIVPDGVTRGGVKVYSWPLFDGASWPVEEGSEEYRWWVAAVDTVSTPFRTFSNCYTIGLITGPDTIYKAFCPGVGVVQYDYYHHPVPPAENWTLISFEPGH
jgi:hypothetical protein